MTIRSTACCSPASSSGRAIAPRPPRTAPRRSTRVVRCIEAGAADYLPKPFDAVLLRARINGCLTKKRLHDLEREYIEQVGYVVDAATAVEEGTFDPDSLDTVAARADALGRLARVFVRMAREVAAREEALKREVQQLRIEIDVRRAATHVAEITETDYFTELQ